MSGDGKQLSLPERIDLALVGRMLRFADHEPLAAAQRVLDGVRRPAGADSHLAASLLRLRGLVLDDDDAADVFAGRPGRLSALSQEQRLLRGLRDCLAMVRARAVAGTPPDGWFGVELFRTMTAELPRFRNNDLRRGPPWDAQLYVSYPAAEQLNGLLDTFDMRRCYRDLPIVFHALHPIRQAFRVFWRFARIAPFPDFNVVIGWLVMNAWLQAKGFPMLASEPGDTLLVSRLIGGPPPTRIVQFEARLLAALGEAA